MRSIAAALIALVLMYVVVNGKKLGLQFEVSGFIFTLSVILLFGSLLFMVIGI